MLKKVLLLFLIFMGALRSLAQSTSGDLAVSSEFFSPDTVIQKADRRSDDTIKVRMFLRVSGVYWRKHTPGGADSCILFAKRAYSLSSKLHFVYGITEALFLECKGFTLKGDAESAKKLLPLVYGEEKVRLLLVIGEYYAFLPGEEKQNLNKAYPFIMQALQVSNSLHSRTWIYRSQLLFAKYYFELGDQEKGKKYVLAVIDDCAKIRDLKTEAFYWNELYNYLPDTEENYALLKHSLEMSYSLYLKINDKKEAVFVLRDLASLNSRYDHLDTAEKQFNQVFSMLHQLKISPTITTLWNAYRLYIDKGDLNRALSFEFKTLEIKNLTDYQKQTAWDEIAHVYFISKSYENSLFYSKKALELAVKISSEQTFYILYITVSDLIQVEGAEKSLVYLNDFIKIHPPELFWQKEIVAALLGKIYEKMGLFAKAEHYYLEMIRLDKDVQLQKKKIIIDDHDNLGSKYAYKTIGAFYLKIKEFRNARKYLEKSLLNPKRVTGEIEEQNEAELLLSRADSALGNYQSALKHYVIHTSINDSI
ncbi:MAG: hypothetical protein JO080_10180, partial [Mucilaginibacter sp.]|nr:hypothetical protein [Mucilaginibacter sp.]